MAKLSAAKSNRSECRKRGPMSKITKTSTRTSTQANSRRRLIPYDSFDYKGLVLVPDNIRILEIDYITKLDREDQSGQNILKLYDSVKEKMVDQRKEMPQTTVIGSLVATWRHFIQGDTSTSGFSPFVDEGLKAQESAMAIDEYLYQPGSHMSARQSRQARRKELERKFQDILIDEAKIFQNLRLNKGELQGLNNYKIHNEIGPPRVIANIKDNVKPDYLCGHMDPKSTFSIPLETWDKIPRSLSVVTPNANETTNCLFLPFLALELKWRNTSERIVQQQLARCLSILAERQARLESLSDSVSKTPIFGLTGVEREFALWVMFRYVTNGNEVHYDMCELASYDLTSIGDVENFHAAMANIHDWVDNERKAHFTRCISSINQNPYWRKVHRGLNLAWSSIFHSYE